MIPSRAENGVMAMDTHFYEYQPGSIHHFLPVRPSAPDGATADGHEHVFLSRPSAIFAYFVERKPGWSFKISNRCAVNHNYLRSNVLGAATQRRRRGQKRKNNKQYLIDRFPCMLMIITFKIVAIVSVGCVLVVFNSIAYITGYTRASACFTVPSASMQARQLLKQFGSSISCCLSNPRPDQKAGCHPPLPPGLQWNQLESEWHVLRIPG